MIKLGLVGAGSIVQSHIDAAVMTNFIPKVICGRKDSVRAKQVCLNNPGLTYARNLEDLLEHEIDALVIALPADIELKVLEKCIEKNIPILIEKPVSLDSSVLKHLVNMSSNKVRVAYNRRFYSSVRSFRSAISNDPGFVQITVPELSTTRNSELHAKKKAILENSVHIFDLLSFTFGKITLANIRPVFVTGTPIAVISEISFASGSSGHMSILFNIPENHSIKYWGKSQNLELCPIEIYKNCSTLILHPPEKNYPVKTYVKDIVAWNVSKEDQILKPGFFEQYSDFYRFIVEDNFESDLANLDDALCALQIGVELVQSFD